MRLVNRVRSWLRGTFPRSRVQNEMEVELRFHVETSHTRNGRSRVRSHDG